MTRLYVYWKEPADAYFIMMWQQWNAKSYFKEGGKIGKKDVPLNYLSLSEVLDILGLKLFAKYTSTRAGNGKILIKKVSEIINKWISGKFMPLMDWPKSVNTFALSKIWYRSAAIDFKCGDIAKFYSKIKSWIYQDSFLKLDQKLLFRKTENGGLGLTHIQSKMTASLLCGFL